jgi:predicted RNA-binding protein with PIN domain
MTRWIVDGNNVMGARADGWWKDRAAAAERLSREIDAWQETQGEPVEVVFDGRESADDVIVRRVEELYATEPDLLVVTSDRGLRDRLPPGVRTEGGGRFLRRLEGDR